jgi:RHS repeat-associated protein
MTELKYDENGSQVTRKGPGHLESSYEFSGYTRLVGVTQAGSAPERYGYDPLGRRATIENGQGKDASSRRFLHDGSRQVLAELGGDGKVSKRYIRTPGGRLVARVDSSSNKAIFYHFDALGSAVAQSDWKGRVVSRSVYDPYGARESRGPSGDAFGFVGRAGVEEDGSGLLMMGVRPYDPTTGAFASRDPLARMGSLTHPYAYADNDPTDRIDPTGLSTLVFDRGEGTLSLYNSQGALEGTCPAANNVVSTASPWPSGTFAYSGHSSRMPTEKVGPYGNFIFDVPGRTGMGVHSGRKSPEDVTEGCIRTTDDAMRDISETNKTDPLTDITVQDAGDDVTDQDSDDWSEDDWENWEDSEDWENSDEGDEGEDGEATEE